MFPANSCRLCIHICNGHGRSLYDEDGRGNEVYALTEKYFSSLFLNMDCVDLFAVICMECWRHISEFHAFQQSVLRAQQMLLVNEPTEVEVKSEEEQQLDKGEREEEFIAIQPKEPMETDNRCGEIATFSQDQANDSGREEQSEVGNFMDLPVSISSDLPSGTEVLIKNASMIAQNLDNVSPDLDSMNDFDRDWEESDEPVVVFVGGELDKYDNESTDWQWSVLSENLNPNREEPSIATPNEQDQLVDVNSSEEILKRRKTGHEFNGSMGSESNTEWSAVNLISDDEMSLDEANRLHLEAVEHIKENVGTELAVYSATTSRPKYKQKRAPALQEYDAFLANWRPNFECGLCSECYASFSFLQKHFDMRHPNEACHTRCCQLKFYGQYEIEKHIRFHMQPNTFKCAQCGACFTTSLSLQTHLQTRHSIRPVVGNHEATPSDSRGFTCDECGLSYKSLQSLRRHIKEMHLLELSTESSELNCPFCPRIFKSRNAYYDHRKAEHATEWSELVREKALLKKTYNCSSCGNDYNGLEWGEHKAKHAGKPIYICSFCPATFVARARFHSHLQKLHHQQWEEIREDKAVVDRKIYKCVNCEGMFETLLAWREHRDTHRQGHEG